MTQPTHAQEARIADLASELGSIEGEIAAARRLVDTPQLPEVSNLLPRISAVCQAVAALPRVEAQSHLETVRRLVVALDELAEKLAEGHRALCERLAALGPQPEHS